MIGIFLFLIAIIIVSLIVSSNGDEYVKELEKKRNTNHALIMDGKINGFVPSKGIRNNALINYGLYIDEANRKIMIAQLLNMENVAILNFDELVECSIIEDGTTLLSGSVGNAVIGGIIGGTTGAIIGASSRSTEPVALSVTIRIITNNIQHPIYLIPVIQTKTIRTSNEYKEKMLFAQEIYATLISAMNIAKNQSK